MPDVDAMLNAHVQFELERWRGEGLADTIIEEADALFAWLETVRLSDVFNKDDVTGVFRGYLRESTISAELAEMVGRLLKSAHKAAVADDTMLGDLVPAASYDRVVHTVVDLRDLREMATTQVTTSEVYSRLMSHVLYQGIKNYIQAENLITRKVPGASTLMRMGQNAISTAAPKLEKTIDRQLTAFVNANIQDSIRESKQYLDKVLDAELLTAVANEIWDTNAKSTVGELVSLVPESAIDEFVSAGTDAWTQVRTAPLLGDICTKVINDFFADHGKRKIASILHDVGVTSAVVARVVSDLLTPAFESKHGASYVEERIRGRLAPFYASYPEFG